MRTMTARAIHSAMAFLFALTAHAQPAATALGKAASDKGFRSCARQLDFMAAFVYAKDRFEFLNTWNVNRPDERLFNSITAKAYPDATTVATFTSVPTVTGRCDSVLTHTTYVPGTSCSQVRESAFAGWTHFADLGRMPVLEDQSDKGGASALLVPAGDGCMVIKQFILYR